MIRIHKSVLSSLPHPVFGANGSLRQLLKTRGLDYSFKKMIRSDVAVDAVYFWNDELDREGIFLWSDREEK